MNIADEIKQILGESTKRAYAATEGPWSDDGTGHLWHEYLDPDSFGYDGEHVTLGRFEKPDFDFIAAARTDLPARDRALTIDRQFIAIIRQTFPNLREAIDGHEESILAILKGDK